MSKYRELCKRGDWYFSKAEYGESVRFFKKALKIRPNKLSVKMKLAESYYFTNQFDKTISICDSYLEHKSFNDIQDLIKIISIQGDAYEEENMYEKAINSYVSVLQLSPKDLRRSSLQDIELYKKLSSIYARVGNKKKASEIWHSLGVNFQEVGNFDDALIAYKKALKLESSYKELWYNIGNLYLKKKDYINAIFYSKKAVGIDPSYRNAIRNLAYAYYKNNNFKLSINEYKKLLKIEPKNSDLWGELALSYYMEEQFENALEACNKSLRFRSNNKSIKKLREAIIKEMVAKNT